MHIPLDIAWNKMRDLLPSSSTRDGDDLISPALLFLYALLLTRQVLLYTFFSGCVVGSAVQILTLSFANHNVVHPHSFLGMRMQSHSQSMEWTSLPSPSSALGGYCQPGLCQSRRFIDCSPCTVPGEDTRQSSVGRGRGGVRRMQ